MNYEAHRPTNSEKACKKLFFYVVIDDIKK